MTTHLDAKFDADVQQVTPRKLLLLPIFVGYAMFMYGLVSEWSLLAGFVLMSAAVAMMKAELFRVMHVHRLVIDPAGMRFRRLRVSRDRVVGLSTHELSPDRLRVTIFYRLWLPSTLRLELEVPDRVTVRAISDALDIRDKFFHRARAIVFRKPQFLAAVAVGIAADVCFFHFGGNRFLGTWVAVVATLIFAYVPPLAVSLHSIVIGRDGISVRNLLGERFVPFDEIVDVKTKRSDLLPSELLLELQSGRAWALDVFPRVAIELKIREALERFRLHSVADPTPPELERRDRSGREWLEFLRSLGSLSTTKYRVAATSPGDLARVLTDESADISARAAAAVALDAIDQKAVVRIRDVAEHTANPKLRVALERIASRAADSEIEESLEDLTEARSR